MSGGPAPARPSARTVLFDAGNTLIFLDYARLAAGVGAALRRPLTGPQLEAVAADAARRLEVAKATDRERATRYLESLFTLAGVPEAELGVVRDTLRELHLERHLWGGVPAATRPALDRLAAAGRRLGVVSNSDGRVESALVAAGLRDAFEVVIDSALVGVEKPDPAIFSPALDALGADPATTLYVGDLYEVDVVGARAAGLDVVLVDPLGLHRHRTDVRAFPSVAAVVDHLLGPAA
ncbi:MAG: HAD family hydrolase [Gemmatimonadales bacterium]|nr:HAD family hydrolase [Gemmatimonadales bacterium]